jgi:hypothetical protein
MQEILSQAMERLSNPEVLFGLAVRFFGVFVVLIIVMIVLWLTGYVFQWLEKKPEEAASPAAPAPPPPEPAAEQRPTQGAGTRPGATVPDEVAIAIALAMVPDEVAVAVAMALHETAEERGFAPSTSARAAAPDRWEQPGSGWKLVGRQQALYRKTSLTRDITPKGE